MTEDDRRFANNPFARALHPERPRTIAQWIVLTVVMLIAAVIMTAALLLPLVFAGGLLRGAHGRWGMLAAGGIVAAVYAMLIVRALRRRR